MYLKRNNQNAFGTNHWKSSKSMHYEILTRQYLNTSNLLDPISIQAYFCDVVKAMLQEFYTKEAQIMSAKC